MYANRKRTRKPRKSVGRKRIARRKARTVAPMETACLKETISLTDIKPNVPYTVFHQLSDFERALDVADNYQRYRLSKLEYKYTPLYDTYTDASGAVSLPYLYAKVMSVNTPDAFTVDYLKTMGAKPRRIDDKTVKLTYKPTVVQSGLVATGTYATALRPLKSPWLSTHTDTSPVTMDATTHLGHIFMVTQENAAAGNITICTLEVVAHFEFLRPYDKTASAPPPGVELIQVKRKSVE